MRKPSVLLADGHVVFTDGIARVLGERFDIAGTVTDGVALLEAAVRLRPHVIVADISLPIVSGIEALRELKVRRVESKVILLTTHADARSAVEAFRAGARGLVLKQSSGEELVKAVAQVVDGEKYLGAALAKNVLALMTGPGEPFQALLTTRQVEVLRLLVNGHRIKEIAARLVLSPRTVEAIKYEMMRELNVHSTTALVRYAIERRLVAV